MPREKKETTDFVYDPRYLKTVFKGKAALSSKNMYLLRPMFDVLVRRFVAHLKKEVKMRGVDVRSVSETGVRHDHAYSVKIGRKFALLCLTRVNLYHGIPGAGYRPLYGKVSFEGPPPQFVINDAVTTLTSRFLAFAIRQDFAEIKEEAVALLKSEKIQHLGNQLKSFYGLE